MTNLGTFELQEWEIALKPTARISYTASIRKW